MKKIEDIENMLPEEIEAAALSEDIRIPDALEDRIMESVASAIVAKETSSRHAESVAADSPAKGAPSRRPVRWLPYASVAAAAAIAAVLLLLRTPRSEDLRDSFDDPYLAYAQVEEAVRMITDKMAVGIAFSEKAGEHIEKPIEIITKFNEK